MVEGDRPAVMMKEWRVAAEKAGGRKGRRRELMMERDKHTKCWG